MCINKYLRGECKENGATLFSVVLGVGGGDKRQWAQTETEKFSSKHFFTVQAIEHCCGLLGDLQKGSMLCVSLT